MSQQLTLIIICLWAWFVRDCLLSVNRSKIVWTFACWCTCSCPMFGVERCPLVEGWFCIVVMRNTVGARTLVRYQVGVHIGNVRYWRFHSSGRNIRVNPGSQYDTDTGDASGASWLHWNIELILSQQHYKHSKIRLLSFFDVVNKTLTSKRRLLQYSCHSQCCMCHIVKQALC